MKASKKNIDKIRSDVKFWRFVSRAFIPSESGSTVVGGEDLQIRGDWAIGYLSKRDDGVYLYGGKTFDEFQNSPREYRVSNKEVLLNNSTGIIINTSKNSARVLFEYDVVTVRKGLFPVVKNGIIMYDGQYMEWIVYGKNKRVKMSPFFKYKYVGKYLDISSSKFDV